MSLLFNVDIHRPNTMAHKQLRMSQTLLFLVRLCNGAGPAVVIGAISTNKWTSLCIRGLGGNVYAWCRTFFSAHSRTHNNRTRRRRNRFSKGWADRLVGSWFEVPSGDPSFS